MIKKNKAFNLEFGVSKSDIHDPGDQLVKSENLNRKKYLITQFQFIWAIKKILQIS